MPPPVLVEGLTKLFPVKPRVFALRVRQYVHAVDGVSFSVEEGEILGLAGESGCGKTTTGKLLVKLLEPTAGRIALEGQDTTSIRRGEAMRTLRSKVQMIFQDP